MHDTMVHLQTFGLDAVHLREGVIVVLLSERDIEVSG